jgi:hypothetical protein
VNPASSATEDGSRRVQICKSLLCTLTQAKFGPQGGGTVYSLDAAGDFSVVYAFQAGPAAGSPMASVVSDVAGNLYGTISANSFSCPGATGSCGIVYEVDTSGVETVLYAFPGGYDGADPVTPVTLDGAGHLYGTADGIFFTPVGGGVAFKITLP